MWPLRDLGKVRGRGIRFHKRTDANTAKAEPSIKRIVLKKNRVQYLIYNFFLLFLNCPQFPQPFGRNLLLSAMTLRKACFGIKEVGLSSHMRSSEKRGQ